MLVKKNALSNGNYKLHANLHHRERYYHEHVPKISSNKLHVCAANPFHILHIKKLRLKCFSLRFANSLIIILTFNI